MGHTQLKQIAQRLIYWSYVHLTVSFFSLLMLSCWGLSLSPLTILGNLIFSPVLYIFLFLCTGLFFSELCHIPNGWLIYLLEHLNHAWLYGMRLAQPYFNHLTVTQPSYMQMGIILTAAIALLLTKTDACKKLCFLLLLIIYSFQYGFVHAPHDRIVQVPCNNGILTIIYHDQELWVIDPGYIGRTSSAAAFIEHRLLPAIARIFGTRTIDHFVLLQPGVFTFQALTDSLERMHLKHLHVPYWQGEQRNLNRAYMQLKQATELHNIPMHRRAYSPLRPLDQQNYITIKHDASCYKKGNITIENIYVKGAIDTHEITIYSAHYMRQQATASASSTKP